MTIQPDPIASATSPTPAIGDRRHLMAAWVLVVAVSAFVDILFVELTGSVPDWLALARLAALAVLVALSSVWRPARFLRDPAALFLALFTLNEARVRIDFALLPLQALFGSTAFDARMQAEQTGKLAVSAGMIGLLVLLGYRRHAFFLTPGRLTAPIEPVPWLGFMKPVAWPVFGLQWGFYIAATLAVLMALGAPPDAAQFGRMLPAVPSILFYAALNAFNEEMTYRAPFLASLRLVGGRHQALWMTAYFFGIAHYFGTPGGLLGGIASIFMGWILGKGMLETRGLFWTWWIHFLSDVAIFTFLALALVR